MTILEADRGYDCGWLRQALLIRGIFPFIPYRKTRDRVFPKTEEIVEAFHLHKKRWKVERAFAWIKQRCRRLLMRWERKAEVWARFVTLGVIYAWLKNLVGWILRSFLVLAHRHSLQAKKFVQPSYQIPDSSDCFGRTLNINLFIA
jgi:transposase